MITKTMQKIFGPTFKEEIETIKPQPIQQKRKIEKKKKKTLQKPSKILTEALKTLQIPTDNKEQDIVYAIINGYNTQLLELHPLNQSSLLTLEERLQKREKVKKAYQVFQENVAEIKKLFKQPKQLVRELQKDTIPQIFIPNLIHSGSPNLQLPEVYETHLKTYQELKLLLKSLDSLNFFDGEETKIITVNGFAEHKYYRNVPVEILENFRKLQKNGFVGQPLPNIPYVTSSERKEEIDNFQIAAGLGPSWWAGKEVFKRQAEHENELWPRVYTIHNNRSTSYFFDDFSNLDTSTIQPQQLFGVFINDHEKFKENLKLRTALHLYLIKEATKNKEKVPKTEEEKRKEGSKKLYEHIFGYPEPDEESLINLLIKLHKLDSKSEYELITESPEELSYPLTPQVVDVFQAAKDSSTFNKLGFLTLKKKEREIRRQVDPILYGTILNNQKVPLCYWA